MLPPLRIITAGNVDDGKSTMIGRLLLDTDSLFADQIDELIRVSDQPDSGANLAFVTDGLRAERARGVTIDAGFRYFTARGRKIILADTPGHHEYTRNMIAAASNAEVAIVLVDAARPIVAQTYRHLVLAHLLGIRQFIVCVNKIDLVDFSKGAFENISKELNSFFERLSGTIVRFIPTSALFGDNIAKRLTNLSWYMGQTLLDLLESIVSPVNVGRFACLTIQMTTDSGTTNAADRIYAGKLLSGSLRIGDELVHFPSMTRVTVSTICRGMDIIETAESPDGVGITTDPALDMKRGDLLFSQDATVEQSDSALAALCWLGEETCNVGKEYLFQQNSRRIPCRIKKFNATLDVIHYRWEPILSSALSQNDIALVNIQFAEPVAFTSYDAHRSLGSGILIDPVSNETVGAGMFRDRNSQQRLS